MAETDNMNLALPGSNEYVDVEVLNENFRKIDAAVLLALAAAAPYSAKTYALGAYCTKGGRLYRCTTAITAAETWTAGHWTETTVTAELIDHATSKSNPHGVTAAQTGAYTKGETDTLLANKANASVTFLPDATDFNSILQTGSYKVFTGINTPIGGEGDAKAYMVIVMAENENALTQLAITYYQPEQGNRTFTRTKVLGSWSEWKELAIATDLDTKVSKIVALDSSTDLNTVLKSGFYRLYGVATNNVDGCYWGTLIVVSDGETAVQILSDHAGAILAKRTYSDGKNWHEWKVLATKNIVPSLAIGSYVGTGTYSSANPNSLTFDFEPKVVIIVQNSHDNFPGTVFIRGQTLSGTIGENYISNSQLTVGWSGNTVTWYTNNSSYKDRAQLNISGNTYFYVALG